MGAPSKGAVAALLVVEEMGFEEQQRGGQESSVRPRVVSGEMPLVGVWALETQPYETPLCRAA